MTLLAEPPAIPAEVHQLADFVLRFRAEAEACNARLAALVRAESQARGAGHSSICSGQDIDLDSAARRAATRLAAIASETFSVTGAPLRISCAELPALDPVELWAHLEAKFGGGRSATMSYPPIAQQIIEGMSIRKDCEMKMVGGRLAHKVYIHYENQYGPSVRNRTALTNALEGLCIVGEWSGMWGATEMAAAAAMTKELHYLNKGSFLARPEIGRSLLIVQTRSSWEFRFELGFAEQLQVFIAEYGLVR